MCKADPRLALPSHCHPGEVIFFFFLPRTFSFLRGKMGTGREPAVGGPADKYKEANRCPAEVGLAATRSARLGFAGSAHCHCCI